MPCDNLVTIRIAKDYLNFSSGHFTIFSDTERERLHGHNFRVQAEVLTTPSAVNGLAFDYGILKTILKALCDHLDERLLLPEQSPFLRIRKETGRIHAHFGEQTMSFPAEDVLLLPLINITVEELSRWFLEQLLTDERFTCLDYRRVIIGVSSGDGQWGQRSWEGQ